MACGSPLSVAQKRQRTPTKADKGIRKGLLATTEGSKSQANTEQQARYPPKQKNFSNPQQIHPRGVKARKRLQTHNPPRTKQAEKKRPLEDQDLPSCTSLEPPLKRMRTFTGPVSKPDRKTLREARTEFWAENDIWPTAEQETTMDRFRELVDKARATKRSLSRKRSNASLNSETTQTQNTCSMSRDQKCAPYKHPLFQRQLEDFGSFMRGHRLGITAESEELCQQLLNGPQSPPQDTLFSEDELFEKTCERLKGENETKVVLRISQLIVPSAEILADKGAKHLTNLRETNNAMWTNSIPFIHPPGSGSGSRSGPRPQPDFGLGFDRDAFSREQLQKLQPFLGDVIADSSLYAATYQMYLPFLTSEVKCGDGELDVADRQNVYAQSVILRGLHSIFRLVGREKELHREISSFSISHNDECVRIWGHYAVIDGTDVKFYRHSIRKFDFTELNGKERWTTYTFVRNIYDLWLPKHFERICSVIDMLPDDLNFEISQLNQELASSRSERSQQFVDYSLADGQVVPDSHSSAQPITPDATVKTGSGNSKTKKTT